METTSFLPSGYCHEGKSSLSSDLHRFQPIGLRFIFTSNNDGHFIGIEECSSVHKDLDGSHIKRQTTVVAYFNRQKGEERSAVGNLSGYRCEADCRSRGREFDPGPVPYLRGD